MHYDPLYHYKTPYSREKRKPLQNHYRTRYSRRIYAMFRRGAFYFQARHDSAIRNKLFSKFKTFFIDTSYMHFLQNIYLFFELLLYRWIQQTWFSFKQIEQRMKITLYSFTRKCFCEIESELLRVLQRCLYTCGKSSRSNWTRDVLKYRAGNILWPLLMRPIDSFNPTLSGTNKSTECARHWQTYI